MLVFLYRSAPGCILFLSQYAPTDDSDTPSTRLHTFSEAHLVSQRFRYNKPNALILQVLSQRNSKDMEDEGLNQLELFD